MAVYIRETIESVLSQDCAELEYIIMDGGSTDGTLDILKSYGTRLKYYSAPDAGTADAVNKGFARASGSLFGWLSADDTYLPGTLNTVIRRFLEYRDAVALHGQGYWVNSGSQTLGAYPSQPADFNRLQSDCCICQPACFFRREAFFKVGGLDPELQFSFDYDLWIRLAKAGQFVCIPDFLATSRMHTSNKTLGGRGKVFRETFCVLRRHYRYVPFNWIYSYAAWLHDRRDQFYEPLRPSVFAYALSLPIGCWQNRTAAWRYTREWGSAMTLRGAVHRCRESRLVRMLQGLHH